MFEQHKKTIGDIQEHLDTLRNLSTECNHITEMGVRKIVSTWAFAEGLQTGGSLIAIDIKEPEEYGVSRGPIERFCKGKGINFIFVKGDSREIEVDETDMLFIDTNHYYDQLKKELELHSDKARKYIVFHDTVSCESELMPAINELLALGKWKVKDHYKNNNGLMVLERC